MAQARQPAIDRLEDRIDTAEDISSDDRSILLDYNDQLHLLGNQYSDYRHEKLLRHVVIMAEEVGGVADALEDKDAAEDLVRWINKKYENEETNRDYRVALRVFGRHMGDGVQEPDDPPKSIDWIPSGTSSTYDPAPRPEEMLHWEEEVVPIIENALNPRDKAAIALQFNAGLRGGEFKDLQKGDVVDSKHGMKVTVDGKQGRRSPTLIPAVPYVQQWLEDHPGDDDDPLWCRLSSPDGLSNNMNYKMFVEPAARFWDIDRTDEDGNKRPLNEVVGDLPKSVTLTNFRKSCASFLASQGLNQPALEDHMGWKRGSDAAARYISVFGEATERELAKAYGKEIAEEDEPDPMAPVTCPRCEKDTPREKTMCVWCGQALEPGAAQVAEEMEEMFVDRMAESDNPDERAAYREAYGELRENPERREEMVDSLMDQFS